MKMILILIGILTFYLQVTPADLAEDMEGLVKTFIFMGEGHSLGNLLRDQILK